MAINRGKFVYRLSPALALHVVAARFSETWQLGEAHGLHVEGAMNTYGKIGTLVAASGFVIAAGCTHSQSTQPVEGTAPPQGVTNAQNAADRHIVEKIAHARCEHEMTCNNVGDGKTYASEQACRDHYRGDVANSLNSYSCPHGIDEGAVDHCVKAIAAQSCGLSVSQLMSGNDCGSDALCSK